MQLYLDDNLDKMRELYIEYGESFADCVYADCIYEEVEFYEWVDLAFDCLKWDGIFYVQTDYHTVAHYKLYLDYKFENEGGKFINWLIYKQEWGGVPKNAFPRKHDDILMYSKGAEYKFYRDRIQVPKVTAGTSLDKKGTGLKTPCDVFDDLGNFHTTSKERIKKGDRNIQWQKPLKLMNRLLLPVTDYGDVVLDPFMGSGSTGEWCKQNNREFIGIENDPEVFEIARKRLED